MIRLEEREFDGFFETPFNAYGGDTAYVSPMKSDLRRFLTAGVNPLFASDDDFTFFTAVRDGRPLGRIVVHVHTASNRLHETNRASFGFFDCADDSAVAAALLQAAETWARNKDLTELAGNFNLTAMQQMGVQTGGFGKPAYTDMIVNPPHIPDLLKQNGFVADFPMTTFDLDLSKASIGDRPPDERFRFVLVKRKDFGALMEQARLVLNDGFAENPMFVPLTSEEFLFQAGEMTTILDPRLSSILAEGDRPVGVVICIPDLNGLLKATRSRFGLLTPWHFLRFRLNRRRAVIIFYSVVRDQHGQGIMGSMLSRTLTALKSAGYERLGITWIADVNPASLRQMERLGAEPLHHLNLFRKDLT